MKSTRAKSAGLDQMLLCLFLSGLLFVSAGCWQIAISQAGGEDATTADARRAAEVGNQLVIVASANCPDAQKEIAAVQAASKAAEDAAKAIGGERKTSFSGDGYYGRGLGSSLDTARIKYEKAEEKATKAAEELSAKKQAYDKADDEYEKADAPYVKAKEDVQTYEIQLASTLKTSTLLKLQGMPEEKVQAKLNPLSGEFDSNLASEVGMDGAKVAVSWAIAKATKKSLEKEHQKNAALEAKMKAAEKEWSEAKTAAEKAQEAKVAAKATLDKLTDEYNKKAGDAADKTRAARIANYNLAQKCPSAKSELGKLDPSHSQGQDVFINTQNQHQEP